MSQYDPYDPFGGEEPFELAPDSLGIPARKLAEEEKEDAARLRAIDKAWLPQGQHWDLHIRHDHRTSTGGFSSGKAKFCIHSTVSSWLAQEAMVSTLHSKSAEVHFVLGGIPGVKLPVLTQLLPLNEYGKGLVHPAGTAETNRAGQNIQIELCHDPNGPFEHLKALANVIVLVHHRVSFLQHQSRSFQNTKRFGAGEYAGVHGIHGHCHVPNNSHWDPGTKFDGKKLVQLIKNIPSGGYKLA